jgi:protein PhnA
MTNNKNIDWDNMEWDDDLGEFVPIKSDKDSTEEEIVTKDSLGNVLNNGDTVFLTRDLDVKGSSLNIKRGTKVKKIKTIGDPELIECKVGKSTIYLKTCFLKKV